MKIYFIILFALFLSGSVVGQTDFPEGKVQSFNNQSYTIRYGDIMPIIILSNNDLSYQKLLSEDGYITLRGELDVTIDKELQTEIILEVLKGREKGEKIGISYYFYPSGKIYNISAYILSNDTKLKLADIIEIDKQLRSKIKGHFNSDRYKRYKILPFSYLYQFDYL